MDEWYIAHSGVKGMKHGRRQYQNEDGTWTELGKARRRDAYGSTGLKNMHGATPTSGRKKKKGPTLTLRDRIRKAKEASAKKKQTKEEEKLERKEALEKADRDEIIRSGDAKLLEANKDRLSNEEINAALSRIDLYNKTSAAAAAQTAKAKRSKIDALISGGEKVKKLLDIWNSDSIKAITGRTPKEKQDRRLFDNMEELFAHRGEMSAKEFSEMYKAMQSAEQIRPAKPDTEHNEPANDVRRAQMDLGASNIIRARHENSREAKAYGGRAMRGSSATPNDYKYVKKDGSEDTKRVRRLLDGSWKYKK